MQSRQFGWSLDGVHFVAISTISPVATGVSLLSFTLSTSINSSLTKSFSFEASLLTIGFLNLIFNCINLGRELLAFEFSSFEISLTRMRSRLVPDVLLFLQNSSGCCCSWDSSLFVANGRVGGRRWQRSGWVDGQSDLFSAISNVQILNNKKIYSETYYSFN